MESINMIAIRSKASDKAYSAAHPTGWALNDVTESDRISVCTLHNRLPITLLAVRGKLDGSISEVLIKKGSELLTENHDRVVMDMRKVTELTTAGLIALHTLTRFINGQSTVATEDGWSAIHALQWDQERSLPLHLKLLGVQSAVRNALEYSGTTHLFDLYDRLEEIILSR